MYFWLGASILAVSAIMFFYGKSMYNDGYDQGMADGINVKIQSIVGTDTDYEVEWVDKDVNDN
jgi:hypothetical protein